MSGSSLSERESQQIYKQETGMPYAGIFFCPFGLGEGAFRPEVMPMVRGPPAAGVQE